MTRASVTTRPRRYATLVAASTSLFVASCGGPEGPTSPDEASNRTWIAGDHHIHSQFSVGWDMEVEPPTPITGVTATVAALQ